MEEAGHTDKTQGEKTVVLGTRVKGEIRCSGIGNSDNAFQMFLFCFQRQQAHTAKNLRTSVLHTAEQHLGK